MEMPDATKGLVDTAKDSVLAVALAIAGIITTIIKTRPKREATQSSDSQKFADLGVSMTRDTIQTLKDQIAMLNERVKTLEGRIDELQTLHKAALQENARLLEENKGLEEEILELKTHRRGNH